MSRDWKNLFPTRRGIFLVGGGVVFGALTARLAELQLFRQAEFESKGEEVRVRLEPAPPHRGTIYDRHGRELASSKRNFYVMLTPELAGGEKEVEKTLEQLGSIFLVSDQRRRSILQELKNGPGHRELLVADDLTWQEFAQVNVMAPELGGVRADVGELRSYPLQGAFYHTIGYVAKADEAAIMDMVRMENERAGEAPDAPEAKARATTIRRLYKHPAMRVGKQGLERSGEAALKGEPGSIRVLQNATGRVIDQLDSKDLAGKAGNDVVLSVDAELQNYAISRFGEESGAAVVIHIATGQVMCMASMPAPDPNLFVSGIPTSIYESYRKDIRLPLLHKAYEGQYPPGSTFKLVVAAAALESGKIDPEDTVYCRGRAYYYDRFYHCWENKGHGSMNLHTGLSKSCDCYFYEIARRIGIEPIAEMAKKFGIMHRYELGITGGKMGVAPNDEWKRTKTKHGRWMDGDTISAAIGQGYVLATPFELAVMCARVAGGPAAANPRFVMSGMNPVDAGVRKLEGLSPRTLDLVRAGMDGVTSAGGTAVRSGMLDPDNKLPAPYTGAKMAGKSGTAQVRAISQAERDASGKALSNDKFAWALRDHALFVAYAPHESPQYACSVVVEHGDSGSRVAAPIARDLLAHCLKYDPGAKKPYVPQKQEVATAEGTKPT